MEMLVTTYSNDIALLKLYFIMYDQLNYLLP